MYKQMEMMSKVGTIDKLMSFLPGNMLGGMGAMSKGQKEAMQGNLDRYRTIMDSMTAWEKNEPAKIKADQHPPRRSWRWGSREGRART